VSLFTIDEHMKPASPLTTDALEALLEEHGKTANPLTLEMLSDGFHLVADTEPLTL